MILDNLNSISFATQGLYHYQIKKYLEKFNPEKLLLLSFEDLKKDAKKHEKNL